MENGLNNVLNVYGLDKGGNGLVGVEIRVSYEGQEIGGGTTRGPNKPFSLQLPDGYDFITVDASYNGVKQTANIPSGAHDYEFHFPVDPPPPPPNAVPTWFPITGAVLGALTLFFFMAILLMTMFNHPVPASGQFIVVIILSFGLAMSFSFVGGSAAASGRIPFFKDSPVQFAVGGGVAVFVIALLLGWKMYVQ